MSDKTIYQLTELENVSQDDELIIYDVSDTTETPTKKVKVKNFMNNSYSTEEQKTGGKWIDGKPIYSRSFSVAGIGSETWTNVTNDSWINTMARIIDCVVSANDLGNGSYGGHPKMRIENGYLQAWEVAGYTAGVMTIEYTKTT